MKNVGNGPFDRSQNMGLGTVTDCYGFFCDNLLNKLGFGVYKTENG